MGRLEQLDDLPAGADPATLTRLLHTITDGITVQAAASGVPRAELQNVAETALRLVLGDGTSYRGADQRAPEGT
ncbi:hypothetical protein [Streptomyces sp. NPDC048196]|uniref:hypothetical protein n=1 Tax=Streptomyces sp. NPDC048196 TaxID=3154712 RepID=UPI00340C3AC1